MKEFTDTRKKGKKVTGALKTAGKRIFRPGHVEARMTEWLRAQKLKARSGGHIEDALLQAGFYAKKQGKTMYLYRGNSYMTVVWRVTYKPSEYLNPINNTGTVMYSVTPELEVLKHEDMSETRVARRHMTASGHLLSNKFLQTLLDLIQPIVLYPSPSDVGDLLDDVTDMFRHGISALLENYDLKLKPSRVEGHEERQDSRDDGDRHYWYRVTHPSTVHLGWAVHVNVARRWAEIGRDPSIRRQMKAGAEWPQMSTALMAVLARLVEEETKDLKVSHWSGHVEDDVIQWLFDKGHVELDHEATIHENDTDREIESDVPRVQWKLVPEEPVVSVKPAGSKVTVSIRAPVTVTIWDVHAPGDRDYHKHGSAPVLKITMGEVAARLKKDHWHLDRHNQSYETRSASFYSVKVVQQRHTHLKKETFEVSWYTGVPSKRWGWKSFDTLKEAVTWANQVKSESDRITAEELGEDPMGKLAVRKMSVIKVDTDDVTRFLHSMKTPTGGYSRRVTMYRPRYSWQHVSWGVEPGDKFDFQRYDDNNQDYDNDADEHILFRDPDVWSRARWDKEYAGPLRKETEQQITGRFGHGLFEVSIDIRGGIDIIFTDLGAKTIREYKPVEKLAASYPGNLGVMEMFRFYKVADQAQKNLMERLLSTGKTKAAWELLQDVTGVQLHPVQGLQAASVERVARRFCTGFR